MIWYICSHFTFCLNKGSRKRIKNKGEEINLNHNILKTGLLGIYFSVPSTPKVPKLSFF